MFLRVNEFLLIRRANRLEEQLRDLTTQLERVAQYIQNLTEELSEIYIGETERELPDKNRELSDENFIVLYTVKILNPPTLRE